MFSPQPIKAVLFDLDGTLRHHLPTGGEVFIEYVRSLGVTVSEADRIRTERWEHLYFASSLEVQEDNKKFKSDLKAFWINFAKRRLVALGLPLEKAVDLAPQVSNHMETSYRPQVFVPQDATVLLNYLQEAGYILGVVSNRDEPYLDELKKLALDQFFSFALAAGEVDSYKPERRIFEHALEMAGTSAAETMYIGDNYFADVVGSLRAGLVPVLYDPGSLFPDAANECAVIKSFSEFYDLLK